MEFEALGEQLVFLKRGAIYNDETKRQAALLAAGIEAGPRDITTAGTSS